MLEVRGCLHGHGGLSRKMCIYVRLEERMATGYKPEDARHVGPLRTSGPELTDLQKQVADNVRMNAAVRAAKSEHAKLHPKQKTTVAARGRLPVKIDRAREENEKQTRAESAAAIEKKRQKKASKLMTHVNPSNVSPSSVPPSRVEGEGVTPGGRAAATAGTAATEGALTPTLRRWRRSSGSSTRTR